MPRVTPCGPVTGTGGGFVSLAPARRRPFVGGGIGFVLPSSFACPIHHNSFRIKHLPLFIALAELGLFGATDRPATARLTEIGFVSHASKSQIVNHQS
jgi:hypothetical protein